MEYDDTTLDYIDRNAELLDNPNPWDLLYYSTLEGGELSRTEVYDFLVNELNLPDVMMDWTLGWNKVDKNKANDYFASKNMSYYENQIHNLDGVFRALKEGYHYTDNLDEFLPEVYNLLDDKVDKNGFLLYYMMSHRITYPRNAEELEDLKNIMGV